MPKATKKRGYYGRRVNDEALIFLDNNKILTLLLFFWTLIFSNISHSADFEEQFLYGCVESCGENSSPITYCKEYCECTMQKIKSHSNSQVRQILSAPTPKTTKLVNLVRNISVECEAKLMKKK